MKFRNPYDFQPTPGLTFTQDSCTEQEWASGCDIVNILRHYMETSDWNLLRLPPRRDVICDEREVIDFVDNDLHTKLCNMREYSGIMREVRTKFNSLDADERAKYGNDYLMYVERYLIDATAPKPKEPAGSLEQGGAASKSEPADGGSAGAAGA